MWYVASFEFLKINLNDIQNISRCIPIIIVADTVSYLVKDFLYQSKENKISDSKMAVLKSILKG